jgi:exopolysaccharide biosynthesis WecB/TagA/CpsF family protein
MIDKGKMNLLGVAIDAVDYQASVDKIVRAARTRTPYGVSALAVHGVMTGVMDDQHRHRLNQLELVVPDGQPVRWSLNFLHGAKLADRVYGPNLMLMTCQAASDERIPIFLFGGDRQLLDTLTERLTARFPKLQIAGTLPSRFRTVTAAEKNEIVRMINDSNAGITFVGLGCPRQEVWAYEFKDHLNMPVIAVGAAFNFHAGLVPQAPRLMQTTGLEWLFRLCCEPNRLWRRYLLLNPYFLCLLFCQWSGLVRFDPSKTKRPQTEINYG